MPDDQQRLAESIRSLTERLERIEARVALLEGGEDRVEPSAPSDETASPRPSLVPDGLLPIVGRTLIVLAGGFLLRALTESGTIPGLAGVAAGLAYAAWWLARSEAAARAGRRTSATLHGLASQGLALPLLLEAVLRFRLIGARGAALILLVGSLATAMVVVPRRLTLVAWSGVTLSVAAALALLIGTHDLIPLTAGLLALGLLVEICAGPGRFEGLRWVAAGGADLSVAILAAIASREGGLPEGYAPLPAGPATVLVLALPVIYVGSAALRTLRGKSQPRVFDLVQTLAALVLGFGAASWVLSSAGIATTPLGWAGMALGAACYVVAFEVIDRRSGGSNAFYAATTLAGVLVLAGGAAAGLGPGLVVGCSLLGIGGIAAGCHFDRQTLRIHGVLYLIAAASAAGLVGAARDGLLAPPPASRVSPGAWDVVAVVAMLAGYLGLIRDPRAADGGSWLRTAPRLLLGATLGLIVAGLGAGLLASRLPSLVAPLAEAGWLAAARTTVLCVLALAFAAVGRRGLLPELRALVYPVLVVTALKFLLEDMPHGQPVTLFLGLAALGGALVAVPRLMNPER
jgi:hypothetical protein